MGLETLDKYHDPSKWRGPAFSFGHIGEPVPVVENLPEVFDSILAILNTQRGERVGRCDFGSDLRKLLWEPHDDFTRQEAANEIKRALTRWEPRISLIHVEFSATNEQINNGILIASVTARLVNNPSNNFLFQIPLSSGGSFL